MKNSLARAVIGVATLLALGVGFAGCASMPDSVDMLQWRDLQGDRGNGVRTRDWAQCSDAVENRRSSMADCMAQKGWAVR